MDWSLLLKNSYKQPWFKIVLILVFLAIFWLVKFSPQKNSGPILSYLPVDTSFFYEWTSDASRADNYFSKINIFDTQVPNAKLNDLKNICSGNCPKFEEIIWFKLSSETGDSYLLKVANWSKQSLKSVREINHNFIFKELSPDVYLITTSKSLADSVEGAVNNKFSIVDEKAGLNIYWQTSQAPEFLNNLTSLIRPAINGEDIFMNSQVKDGKTSLKFFQATNNQVVRTKSFSEVALPKDFSLALGFSSKNSAQFLEDIIPQLVEPIFVSLPEQNFQKNELNTYLASDNLLLGQGEDWLLVGFNDWQPQVNNFLSKIEAKEVRKTLPDGTVYTELQAADDQTASDHEFKGQKYWQIGDLFGGQLNSAYYLTNRQYFLEQVIDKPVKFAAWWPCGAVEDNIGDILAWSVPALPNVPIRTYLQNINVESLNISSFSNNSTQGWQICVY